MGCHALLQGIFPTWGSNPGLPHCRRILYHLSHQGSPMSPKELSFESWAWTSVAVQWLRLHWTIQRTQVQSLVWELRSICCQVWLKYKIQSLNYTFESQAFLPGRESTISSGVSQPNPKALSTTESVFGQPLWFPLSAFVSCSVPSPAQDTLNTGLLSFLDLFWIRNRQ